MTSLSTTITTALHTARDRGMAPDIAAATAIVACCDFVRAELGDEYLNRIAALVLLRKKNLDSPTRAPASSIGAAAQYDQQPMNLSSALACPAVSPALVYPNFHGAP